MGALSVFDFEDTPVRVVQRDGVDWFVAADVCRCLGLENSRQAMTRIPDDEKMEFNLRGGCFSDGIQANTVAQTNGIQANTVSQNDGIPRGNPNVTVVNEPGLYRLIFRSEKPEAERLKRFVFHDVLPQLRRTGRFAPDEASEAIGEKLRLVAECRRTQGRKAAAGLWDKLGLPSADPQEKPMPPREGMGRYLHDFMLECTVEDPRGEVRASAFHAAYQRWAARTGSPYMTMTALGMLMRDATQTARRVTGKAYLGLRLKPDSESAKG